MKPTRCSRKLIYIAVNARPGNLPRTEIKGTRQLNPSHYPTLSPSHYLIYDPNSQSRASGTDLLQPLKTLLFLSFRIIQQTRITTESKHCVHPFEWSSLRQSTRRPTTNPERKEQQSSTQAWGTNRTKVLQSIGIEQAKWSIVSDTCAQMAHKSSSCNPCLFRRATVQHLSCKSNQRKNLHLDSARVLRINLAPSIGCCPMKSD